jgi:hypothetical protein
VASWHRSSLPRTASRSTTCRIADVDRDELLVHREPSGDGYANIERLAAGDTISPLIDVPPVDIAALLAR